MSAFSQILRRTFSTASLKLFYKEKDISKLVQSFKDNTQNVVFRRKASYYEFVVQQLTRAKAFGLIEEILEDQKQYVEITNEGFAVRLISLYGKSGLFDRARQLFDEMPELKCVRTVKSFNALLGACVSSKKFDKIEGFFRELPGESGIKPDVVSYNTVIKGFCEMGSLDLARSMLDEMEKDGICPDLITFNTLFDGFYKKGRFLDGEKFWDLMKKYNVVPDIISYNMRIHGLVLQDKIQESIDLVDEIKNTGLDPDKFTFNLLFKGLCSDGKYIEEAKRQYFDMVKANCEPDMATFVTLLPFACDNGDFMFAARLCRKLLRCRFRLKGVNVVQKVIDGLVKQSFVNEAELLVKLGKESKHSCYHSLKIRTLGK
ncbi:hypothetical protein RND81_07G136100 [Saponaria officinalis]|uniref:Pentatricopeptide repeat-containing protein n=1 Tax=Saponaria officinalis TaxID=3572 RepID=A0AAW1JQC5_SAPOF